MTRCAIPYIYCIMNVFDSDVIFVRMDWPLDRRVLILPEVWSRLTPSIRYDVIRYDMI